MEGEVVSEDNSTTDLMRSRVACWLTIQASANSSHVTFQTHFLLGTMAVLLLTLGNRHCFLIGGWFPPLFKIPA